MKVHFFTSWSTVDSREGALRALVAAVHDSGHVVATDWIDYVLELAKKEEYKEVDWMKVYKQNLEDIAKSDVVIAEATGNSFAVGYQVACAIQQKKPVLILKDANANAKAYSEGVVDDWVQHKKYNNLDELKSCVEEFLKENDIQSKDMRFNFFIDRPIYNYLRWSALKTGKTKAEILRELVEREIDREKNV